MFLAMAYRELRNPSMFAYLRFMKRRYTFLIHHGEASTKAMPDAMNAHWVVSAPMRGVSKELSSMGIMNPAKESIICQKVPPRFFPVIFSLSEAVFLLYAANWKNSQ